MKYCIGKILAQYHPAFSKRGKFIEYEFKILKTTICFTFSHPVIAFASVKREKSDVTVVNLCVADPSSHDGMLKVIENLIPYLPKVDAEVNQKTMLFGDQLFVERGLFSF